MLVTINPVTSTILLTSIPRDSYVTEVCDDYACNYGVTDKLTHTGMYGVDTTKDTIENLLDIARIKYMAKSLYITKIASKRTAVVFTFEQSKFDVDIPKLVSIYKNRLKFSPGVKPMITLDIGTTNERQILNDVAEFLKNLEHMGQSKNVS